MASFNHISGQEPSTVTFKAATVTMTRNSSLMHQELISLADPESSLSIARVSSAAPASSDAGLIVRQVGHSTIVSVAALPANSSQVEIRAITGPVSTGAPATGDTGVIVRQVGYSTVVTVAAMPAGSSGVTVNAWAAGLISSAAAAGNSSALLVRVVGGPSSAADFIQNVSSVAGVVTVTPNSTGWVKSAGLSVDSSNYLNVNASFTGSTDVSVSKLPAGLLSSAAPAGNSSALLVRLVGGPSSAGDAAITVHGNVSSNSSVYLPVRLTNGTAFLAATSDYTDASTTGTITGPTLLFDNGTNATMRAISITRGLPVNVVAGAVAGPTSTAAPASNDTGLVVRQVGYSTVVSVAAMPAGSTSVTLNAVAAGLLSSAAAAGNSSAILVRVVGGPSSAADFIQNVSSVAGIVAVRPSDTNWASSAGFHFDSSGALNVAASFAGSTDVSISRFAAGLVSSAVAAGNSSALMVRVVGGASSAADFVSNVSSVAGIVAVRPSDTNWASSAGFHFDSSGALNVAASFAGSTDVSISKLPAGLLSSAAAAGNSSALLVRLVGGPSSAGDVSINVANFSTTVSVAALPANSSIVALGSVAAGLLSTGNHVHGSSALLVRQAVSSLQSTTFTLLSSNSTALYTFLSSVAGRTRVYSYFIGASTNANHSTLLIGDSTTPARWAVIVSSGVFGANMAVAPPGFLFEAAAGNALQARIESASTGITLRVAVSYFID